MNTPSQNDIHNNYYEHFDKHIDTSQYIHFNKHEKSIETNNKNISCCNQKIDMCIFSYFKYLFYMSLLLTNICNIVLNYNILNK